jgi:hypothetical protein
MRLPDRMMAARLLAAASLLCLAGCGGDVERTLGLTRDSPDEFTVTTRAPLSMPPDEALPAPHPGVARPQELTSQQSAEAALAPDTALGGTAGPDSSGQEALVGQAGPSAPSNIRNTVDAEAAQAPRESLTDRLMFWQPPPQAPAGAVLDPAKESERLRENAALGQKPTAGDTPIIQPKKSSGWLGLF